MALIPVNSADEGSYPVQHYALQVGSSIYTVTIDPGNTGNVYVNKSTDGGATFGGPLDQTNAPKSDINLTVSPAVVGTDIWVLLGGGSNGYHIGDLVRFDTGTDTWDTNFYNAPLMLADNHGTQTPGVSYYCLAAGGDGLVALVPGQRTGPGFDTVKYSTVDVATVLGFGNWPAPTPVSPTGESMVSYRANQILVEAGGRIQFILYRDVYSGPPTVDSNYVGSGLRSVSLNSGVLGTVQTMADDLNGYFNPFNTTFNLFGVPYSGIGTVYVESSVTKYAVPYYYGSNTNAPRNGMLLATAGDNPTWSFESVDTTERNLGFENLGCPSAAVFSGGQLTDYWVVPLTFFPSTVPPRILAGDVATGKLVSSTRTGPGAWTAPIDRFTPGANLDPTGVIPVFGGSGLLVSVVQTDTFNGTLTEKIESLLQYFPSLSSGPTCSLTATPTEIVIGCNQTTICWTTTGNPTSAILTSDHGSNFGAVDPTGGCVIDSPRQTATYTLTVSNSNGTSICQVTVIVVSISCTLSASSTTIEVGQSVTLTWTTAGSPDTAFIDSGVGAVNPLGGSVVVFPPQTTTYTLTVERHCQFHVVMSTCQVTIVVAAAPFNPCACPQQIPTEFPVIPITCPQQIPTIFPPPCP